MREFICLLPIDHDQRHYAIGDPIVLDETAGAVLLADQAIAEASIAAVHLGAVVRGSDYLPMLIRLSPQLTVPQAEIVDRALSASGLDRANWNGLSDDERELQIVAALELYRGQVGLVPVLGDGLGRIIAAAEGDRVAADNAALAALTQTPQVPVASTDESDPAAPISVLAVDDAGTTASDVPAGKTRRS